MGLTAVTTAGGLAFVLRLGWRPTQAAASLWAIAFHAGGTFVYYEDGLPGPTTSSEADSPATYEFGSEARIAVVERSAMVDRFSGGIRVSVAAHPKCDAPSGPGTMPIVIEARFDSRIPAQNVRRGRYETPGPVEGTVSVGGTPLDISAFGKWHEQRGPRPRFAAAAFTYMSISGESGALLANRGARGASGYLAAGGAVTAVREFDIDGPGPSRTFRVALDDGRIISGEARTRFEYSIVVDGGRRPGAIIAATTGVGPMVGELNDWDPPPAQ